MKNGKLLVQYETTVQVSPDDWRVMPVQKLFNELATLREVKEWIKNQHPETKKQGDDFKLFEVKLSEPQQ